MTDDLDQLAAAGAETKPMTLDELREIADEMSKWEAAVAKAEAALKERKKKLNEFSLDKLPAAMKAAGVKKLHLDDGRLVELAEEFTLSVPKKRKAEIIKTLRDPGTFGEEGAALISNVITVDLPKGKDNVAAIVMDAAAEQGLEPVRAEDVNSASLKALLRRRYLSGKHEDDLAFFGAHIIEKATIS